MKSEEHIDNGSVFIWCPNGAGTRCTVIERINITLTPNGEREFVPREQVTPLLVVYSTLFLHINISFAILLSLTIVLSCFYLLIFYFEKFST